MRFIYTVVRSLNNNLVLAQDDHHEELVLFGTGIGFKKKKGDFISDEYVTKVFQIKTSGENTSRILDGISPEMLSLAEKIISLADNKLQKAFNGSLLIALADHIQSAIERISENMTLNESNLQWEIPFLYHNEYEVGTTALKLIKAETDVDLPDIEASFIALHLVNAQQATDSMDETMHITEITKSIVMSIQSYFNISLKKDTIDYSRFVTHIRYFMNRQLRKIQSNSSPNDELYGIIEKQYPDAFLCAQNLRTMLQREYSITVNNDEIIYLVIHIQRILQITK